MTSQSSHRFVSLLTRQCLALVLAGGQGGRLHELTKWRPTAAVPFGGKLRIIDFALSNCVNSGIRQIGVLTQYKAHSLIQHLVQGWSRFRRELGESLEILPASQRSGGVWYQGTADAIYQNLDIIRTHRPEYVLVLSGDHVYKMDYGPMLASHVETQAEMTISCVEVPIHEAAGAYGVMQVDDHNRVVGFEEKPAEPKPTASRPDMCLASMGSYVFNTDFLYRQLIEDADDEQSSHEFGKDIIPKLIEGGKVFAYPFRDLQTGACGCWRNVGTLDALWQANMELMSVSPELNLYDLDWPILTHQPQLPPAKFVFNDPERRGMAVDSMVSSGCLISGAHLERTLLFSNVRVHSYAEVEDSLVFPNVDIGSKARIKRAIIDRSCQIPNGMVIGEDHAEDREHGFRISDGGVVLVTPDMLGQSVHLMR